MDRRFWGLLAVFCALSGQVALAESSYPACTCTPASFSGRWRGAEAVFVGTVENISVVEALRVYGGGDLPVEVSLHVDAGFKTAQAGEKFVLKTSLTKDTCLGYPFRAGEKYLVFAYQRLAAEREDWSLYPFPSDTYGVGGLCGGTKPFDDSATGADLQMIAVEIDKAEALRKSGAAGALRGIKKEKQ